MPAESLAVSRWIFGLSLLLFLTPHSAWIDLAPRALFDPPLSPAYFFRTFPPPPTFLVLDIVTLIAIGCLTVGYRTRAASVVFVVCYVFTSNFRYSFGKMGSDFLTAAIVCAMFFTDWGAYYSVDALNRPADRPADDVRGVSLAAVFVAFGMFTAGLPKLFQWVDLNLHTSGFLGWYLTNYFMLGRTFFLASYALKIPPIMAEAADYAAPLVELIGFAALLVSRKTWLLWMTALICFHLANIFILNIPFHDYVLIYLVFIDWTRLRIPASLKKLFSPPVIPSVVVLALVVIHTIARLAHRGSTWVFITKTGASEIWDLYVSVPVCVLALAFFVHAVFGEFHDKRTAGASAR